MVLTIDTVARVVRADGRAYPLYSAEAFRAVSEAWLPLGWNREYWAGFHWMGRQILQLPDDILRLAEAVWRLRPETIVETGVYDGGSTLLFASLCRLGGRGRVISIEKELRTGVREAISAAAGDIVTLVEADSADPGTALSVRTMANPEGPVFVFLDSDHSYAHVRAELEHYAPLVTPGSYVVVADTILPGLASAPQGDARWRTNSPAAAVSAFLSAHPEFEVEPCGPVTYFPGGWLRRRSAKND